MARGQAVHQRAAAERVPVVAIGGEVHAMPLPRQRVDHRIEVLEVGEVPRDEEDVHETDSGDPTASAGPAAAGAGMPR